MKKSAQQGVTLIELIVVIVIIAILGSLALPAYRSYAEKARRADAKSGLSSVLLSQERYFTVNGEYRQGSSASPDSPFTDLELERAFWTTTAPTATVITSEKGYYQITVCNAGSSPVCTAPSSTGFTLRATAQNEQLNDTDCALFQITHLGVKTAYKKTGSTFSLNTDQCW